MRQRLRRPFRSLAIRNYRLYFAGQVVSSSGTWVQQIAIAWLALRLTNSSFALGVVIALQTLPYVFIGPWGGLLADRLPKRKLLIWTQLAQTVPPLLLFALTASGAIQIWMVYVISLARGFVNVFDNPVRQSFVPEMVGRDYVVSAVSLNASVIQAGRLIGPAFAAIVIATLGLSPCFLINAVSFVWMVVMLLLMRPEELTPSPVTPRGPGQLRAGLRLVLKTPDLRVPLVMMAVIGLLSFNFLVVLPAVAKFTYHGTATTYALMMNFLAAGALFGAILAGTRTVVSRRTVSWAAVIFGVALGVAGVVDNLAVALLALIAVGGASVAFSASVQSALQLAAEPAMRGRVLAIYQLFYQGTTPFGSLLVGALAATVGARSGLIVGGLAALGAGILGLSSRRRAGGVPVAAVGAGENQA